MPPPCSQMLNTWDHIKSLSLHGCEPISNMSRITPFSWIWGYLQVPKVLPMSLRSGIQSGEIPSSYYLRLLQPLSWREPGRWEDAGSEDGYECIGPLFTSWGTLLYLSIFFLSLPPFLQYYVRHLLPSFPLLYLQGLGNFSFEIFATKIMIISLPLYF